MASAPLNWLLKIGDTALKTTAKVLTDAVNELHDAKNALITRTEELAVDIINAQDEIATCNTVFNTDGSITETLGNGKVRTTVFNSNGSITQTTTNGDGTKIILTTTFNADGSITRAKA